MNTENSGELKKYLEASHLQSERETGLPEVFSELLEAVLNETVEGEGAESYQLISSVARQSNLDDSENPAAMQEVVRAIVDRRFGTGRLSNNLVRRIAGSLMEIPEVTRRLSQLWQEARQS